MLHTNQQFGRVQEGEHEDHLSNWDAGAGLYWEPHLPARIGNPVRFPEPDDLDQSAFGQRQDMAKGLAGRFQTRPGVHTESEQKKSARHQVIHSMDRPLQKPRVQAEGNALKQESSGSSALLLPSTLEDQCCNFCHQRRGSMNRISTDDAIAVFTAKTRARDPSLSSDLARKYGISPKAVRDIWNLRTWWTVTWPFWSAAHKDKFRKKLSSMAMCVGCRSTWLKTIQQDSEPLQGQGISAEGHSAADPGVSADASLTRFCPTPDDNKMVTDVAMAPSILRLSSHGTPELQENHGPTSVRLLRDHDLIQSVTQNLPYALAETNGASQSAVSTALGEGESGAVWMRFPGGGLPYGEASISAMCGPTPQSLPPSSRAVSSPSSPLAAATMPATSPSTCAPLLLQQSALPVPNYQEYRGGWQAKCEATLVTRGQLLEFGTSTPQERSFAGLDNATLLPASLFVGQDGGTHTSIATQASPSCAWPAPAHTSPGRIDHILYHRHDVPFHLRFISSPWLVDAL